MQQLEMSKLLLQRLNEMMAFDGKANAYLNEDFFYIEAISQGILDFAEPSVEPWCLDVNVADNFLGSALRAACAAGKHVDAIEFQEILKSGVVQAVGTKRNLDFMEKWGYKSKAQMLKNMRCCWVSMQNGNFQIKPTLKKSIDVYSGISNDGPEILRLPINSENSELGAALREGFRRCIHIDKG